MFPESSSLTFPGSFPFPLLHVPPSSNQEIPFDDQQLLGDPFLLRPSIPPTSIREDLSDTQDPVTSHAIIPPPIVPRPIVPRQIIARQIVPRPIAVKDDFVLVELEDDDEFVCISEDDLDASIEDGGKVSAGQKKALKKDTRTIQSNSGNKQSGFDGFPDGGYIFVDDANTPPSPLEVRNCPFDPFALSNR